ncbi:hypothetical protein AB0L32_07590, partial [Micrococcus luteus]
MKIGLRKPSLKKSIKARTTGRAKRAIKRKVIPGYGCQGPLSSAHRRPVFLPAGGHQNCPLVASWFA